MTGLDIRCRATEEDHILALTGHLDNATTRRFRETLQSLTITPGQRLIIDLTGVTFCDSSGVTALVIARNLTLAAHGDIVLAGIPDHLARTLTVVGLDQVFPTRPSAAPNEEPPAAPDLL